MAVALIVSGSAVLILALVIMVGMMIARHRRAWASHEVQYASWAGVGIILAASAAGVFCLVTGFMGGIDDTPSGLTGPVALIFMAIVMVALELLWLYAYRRMNTTHYHRTGNIPVVKTESNSAKPTA